MADQFIEGVAARTLTVGVVGLGYVGLPLAVGYGEAGFRVVGMDADPSKVALLNAGNSHIEDVSREQVAALVASGDFIATCEPEGLEAADTVFICVPTPFDSAKTPDLSFVRSAAEAVSRILHEGMLVVLQSTTFPGTTDEVVRPILERTGLVAGVDFNLAFSPERVDPGNATWTVRNTPKVVGGLTSRCAARAHALLRSIMGSEGDVKILSSPAAAEMTKLLENTYRAVNIALVNELAMLAHEMDLDLWEVIDGAATKPFGFQPFYPGVGPGGHCIPVDPYYLSWRAREFEFQTKFIELAADTNLRMAAYSVERIRRLLNRIGRPVQGSRILVLGVTFKPGVADTRNSRTIRLMELLREEGAEISYSDPYVPSLRFDGQELKSQELTADALEETDLVVAAVAHEEFQQLGLHLRSVSVFDLVNLTNGAGHDLVERL